MIRVRIALAASLVTAASVSAVEHGYPAFSPDGEWLVFSSDAAGSQDLYRVNRSGEEVMRLTSRTDAETQPTWSPDGNNIAYVRKPWNPSSQPNLFIIDRDGANDRRLGELLGVHLPDWGEDGRIYFSMRVNASQRHSLETPRWDGPDQSHQHGRRG